MNVIEKDSDMERDNRELKQTDAVVEGSGQHANLHSKGLKAE